MASQGHRVTPVPLRIGTKHGPVAGASRDTCGSPANVCPPWPSTSHGNRCHEPGVEMGGHRMSRTEDAWKHVPTADGKAEGPGG